MLTLERRTWLKENKRRGDIAKAVKTINPNGDVDGLNVSLASNILSTNTWGRFGEIFCDTLEEIINSRIAQEKAEKKKYAKTA